MPMTGDIWNNQESLKDDVKTEPRLPEILRSPTDLPTELGGWTLTGADWNDKDPHSQYSYTINGCR
jgi:hypothetical protein